MKSAESANDFNTRAQLQYLAGRREWVFHTGSETSARAMQGDANDWLVTFTYFMGDTLWFVATSFQIGP